jgi:hypothetical protein
MPKAKSLSSLNSYWTIKDFVGTIQLTVGLSEEKIIYNSFLEVVKNLQLTGLEVKLPSKV